MGTVRWTYNKCVSWVYRPVKRGKQHPREPHKETLRQRYRYDPADTRCKKRMEKMGVSEEKRKKMLEKKQRRAWVYDTPSHVRDVAIEEFVRSWEMNRDKEKRKPGFKFHMWYRSKKDRQQTLSFEPAVWGCTPRAKDYYDLFGSGKMVYRSPTQQDDACLQDHAHSVEQMVPLFPSATRATG